MMAKLKEERICACCGKPFFPSAHSHGQQYCSYECQRTVMKQRQREEYWKSRVTLTCPVCGKTFITQKKNHRTYCTDKCYLAAARQRQKNQETEMRRCIRCGKLFEVKKYYGKQYCSDACRYPTRRGAYNRMVQKEVRKDSKDSDHEPVKRGIHQTGIIPRTVGWNSPIPQKEDRPAPRVRLKCDPSKLPKPLLPPTRQYRGPDPDRMMYEQVTKEASCERRKMCLE